MFIIQLPPCDAVPEEQKELLQLEGGGERESEVQRAQVALGRKAKKESGGPSV